MPLDPSFYLDTAPSFHGRPFLYMFHVGSLLLTLLLALEWGWRLSWNMVEQKAKLTEPATAQRAMVLLLMIAVVLRLAPDLVLFAAWPDLSPDWRAFIAVADKRLDPAASFVFSLAWVASYLGAPMIVYQLRREPLPVHLIPTWAQAKRPLKIGAGAFAMAFALAFLR